MEREYTHIYTFDTRRKSGLGLGKGKMGKDMTFEVGERREKGMGGTQGDEKRGGRRAKERGGGGIATTSGKRLVRIETRKTKRKED